MSQKRIKAALIDTNFIVAILNRNDPRHDDCAKAVKFTHANQWLTTWPVITEAMYLLNKHRGVKAQERLCNAIEIGKIGIVPMPRIPLIRAYLTKYADLALDFADASLAAAASETGIRSIFTLGADFRVVRVPIDSDRVMDVLG